MAPGQGQLRASRYFIALFIVIAALWGLVVWKGAYSPKLGLDLQGGSSMTLSATADGKAPDQRKMEQAREIIANRVNDTGVAEPEVLIEGTQNIVVNVAGGGREDLEKVGEPAQLRFREVTQQTEDLSAAAKPDESKSPDASASPSKSGKAKGDSDKSPLDSSASPKPSGSASPSGSKSPSPAANEDPSKKELRESAYKKLGGGDAKAGEALVGQIAQAQIDDPKKLLENPQAKAALAPFSTLTGPEVGALPAAVQFKVPSISCEQLNSRDPGDIEDPNAEVVSCDTDGKTKYLLAKAQVLGTDVNKADFTFDPTRSQWIVTLSFNGSGQEKWTNLTAKTIDKQVAVVMDNEVVSAPTIQDRIAGDAEITGDFNRNTAETLAAQLRYGALPLTFKVETITTVTPTLGLEQMQAGLLAGAIGVGLVFAYALIYYRLMGFVVIATLGASAGIVYGLIVLLGLPWFGFTVTLAGIAGFIVAVGITADSFVVFFERIKDEIKEGRTVRSAVPRAWERSRRTILSANAISILAAAVLYILAIGAVKGFAFTLGLSTTIDLVLVFLFTHPLVAVLSRFRAFSSPRVSGLGRMRADLTARGGKARGAVTKES